MKILIVDGSHYLYRAYYGVPKSAKLPSGLGVNAVYGFMAYLRKAVKFVGPAYIAIVFDSETGIAEKVVQKGTYKANRINNDTGMYEQLPLIKNILDYLSIGYAEPPNYEADDYIGSLTRKASNKSIFSMIFSNDADFLQLIDSNINVVKMGQKGPEIINTVLFEEKYGFKNDLYLDYLAMKGDASDNIKGIPGIGHKTAQGMVINYGSLKGIYSNLESFRDRIRKLLIDNRQLVESNKEFLKINVDIGKLDFNFKETENFLLEELDKSTNYLLSKVGVDTK